jgi:hypothetical protein
MYSKRTDENNRKGTINFSKDKHDDIVDLTNVDNTSKKYLCPVCKELLQEWPALKWSKPYSGPGYRCSVCDKVYDSSLTKLPTVINKSKPTMTSTSNNEPIIMFLNENAPGVERPDDDYDKNDPEPGDDQNKRMEGWHIVDSKIELKDRQGNNRTLFKKDMDHMSTQY